MRPHVIFVLMVTCFFSCSAGGQSPDSTGVDPGCILLNDSAVGWYMQYIRTSDTNDIRRAIRLVDEAIKCDSTYQIARYNEYSFLLVAKDYPELLTTALGLHKTYGDQPAVLTLLGTAYRLNGDTVSADSVYQKALRISTIGYSKQSCDVSYLSTHYVLYAYFYGKEETVKKMKRDEVESCGLDVYDQVLLAVNSEGP